MRKTLSLAAVALAALVATGCGYIVPPPDDSTPTPAADHGWGAVVTGVTEASGALHVDIALRNDTGDWSALDAATAGSAHVTSGGKTTDCGTVFVSTGGTSLAPGFVMSGYTGGSVAKPVVQPLYVECAGVTKSAGMTLAIDYSYVTGPYNYYSPSKPTGATFSLNLDKVVGGTKFPVATTVAKLIDKPADKITAINGCTIQLLGTARTATGLEFTWKVTNGTDYPVTQGVHIGTPPVIGSDGVIYGFYESPHLADAPIAPAHSDATWKTTVAVPAGVKGLYILLSVESQQQKYFINHVVDITDK